MSLIRKNGASMFGLFMIIMKQTLTPTLTFTVMPLGHQYDHYFNMLRYYDPHSLRLRHGENASSNKAACVCRSY